MLTLAFILALFGLLMGIYLSLAAASSHKVLASKYPEYVHKVFRPTHQVVTRQGGPVRLLVLLRTPSPKPGEPLIYQLRALGFSCAGSLLLAGLCWLAA